MSADKDELAGAGRLTRAIGVTLSADVDSPPRLLGPLASREAWDALRSRETWDAFRNQAPPPVAVPTLEQEERNERLVEAMEELGPDEALKALQRKAPGAKAGAGDDRYQDLYVKAMVASGGNLSRARSKFKRLTGLSLDRARKRFATIHKQQK